MITRQAVLGGFLAAALVFGSDASPVAQAGGQASVAGFTSPFGRQPETVRGELRTWRKTALDVVFDVYGAVIAQAKQF